MLPNFVEPIFWFFWECKFSRMQNFLFIVTEIFFKQAKMKKLSSMWTYDVEIEACLDSRIFRIKELRILFRGKFKFSKFDFFFRVHLFSWIEDCDYYCLYQFSRIREN